MKMKDYYAILQVHPKASAEIIKKAYITLAKQYHPDVTKLDKNIAEQKMQELNEAYRILSDVNLRKNYDRNYFASNSQSKNNTQDMTEVHANDAYEKSINNLFFYCKKYNDLLDAKVRKTPEAAGRNKIITHALAKEFSNDIAVEFKLLNENGMISKDLLFALSVTMYNFAICFTWGLDYASAKLYMNMARPGIINTNLYKDFEKNYNIILKGLVEQNDIPQTTTINNKKINNRTIVKTVLSIIAALFILGSIFGEDDKPKANVSAPKQPEQQTTQWPTPPKQQKINDTPIPKKNVLTGYIPNTPVLNNQGLCELTIDNTQNDTPVYVRLWSITPAKPVRTFTIAAYDKIILNNITPGNYEIRYKHLYENMEAKTAYKSQTFDLTQTYTASGTNYSVASITLYKVRNGNFRTYDLNANEI